MRIASPRLLTIEAMALLPLARVLVNRVQMKHWRGTLGEIEGATISSAASPTDQQTAAWCDAARLGRHVERAAEKLPVETKCLPRAIALQWMLRRRAIASRLIVARSHEKGNRDEWHAWVEHGEEIVIGHCDRDDYRAMLIFTSRPARSADPTD